MGTRVQSADLHAPPRLAAAGPLIGPCHVTSHAGFKAECRCQLRSARALETGVETTGLARRGAGRARLTGGKGAPQAEPRRSGYGAGGAGVDDRRKAGSGVSRGSGEGVSV